MSKGLSNITKQKVENQQTNTEQKGTAKIRVVNGKRVIHRTAVDGTIQWMEPKLKPGLKY